MLIKNTIWRLIAGLEQIAMNILTTLNFQNHSLDLTTGRTSSRLETKSTSENSNV